MPDTSQGISVGDAVLTFLADTSQLDTAFDSTEQRSSTWANNVTDNVNKVSDSLKQGFTGFDDIVDQQFQAWDGLTPRVNNFQNAVVAAGEAADGSMREARGSIALLGEEIGVHVPRHLQTFIAGLPGVGAAMSAAFAPIAILALIDLGSKLIDKITDIVNHADEVSQAWQKVNDDAVQAFTHTGDEILQVEARIDELNNDKLGALEKNLELIDHASLADLAKQIETIQKDTDDAFTKMHTWWDWITTLGQGNSGIAAAKSDFDDLTKKLQNIANFGSENPDPFGSLKTSLDGAKQKVADLEAKQKEAGSEQQAVLQQEIDAENRRILMMTTLSSAVDTQKQKVSDLQAEEAKLNAVIAQGNESGDREMAGMIAAAETQKDAIDKEIDARNKEITALGHYVNLQLQSNKLEQDRVTLATHTQTKDKSAEAQALLDAQKTLGDAMLALIKSQDTQQIEETEQHYSLENAATNQAFAEQLSLLTAADLQKRAIQAKADDDAYQFQLKMLQARLELLQKSDKDTEAEQIKVNAEIEALHVKHQTTLVDTYTKMMETLRETLSQPIPLVTVEPQGMDQIENAVTKGFQQAQDAAAALGLTLRSQLDEGIRSAYDNYSKLETLFHQGIITQKDLDNGYIKLVQSELDFAKATGASADQVKKLQTELDQLTGKETTNIDKFGKHTQMTFQQFLLDMKQGVSGMQELEQAGVGLFNSLSQGMESAVASAIMGQKSFGQAMAEATASALASLAAQAAVKALFYTGEGFAALASFDYSGAAQFFEAAGIMAAVGGAAAVAGHALAGAAGTNSSSSSTPKGTAAPAAGSTATTAATQPTQVVNITHLATGGVTSGMSPMLAMIGDAEHGGAATEAVLPLENSRAMQAIADALVPALLKALGTNSSAASFPRFFDGALVSSPMLAWIGDTRSGDAATEGVLPLEDSTAMSKIASSIVTHLVNVPLPPAPRYEAAASTALLSSATLSAAAAAAQHGAVAESPERFVDAAVSANEKQISKMASELHSQFRSQAQANGGITLNVEGVISPDNLDKVISKIDQRTRTGRVRLHSTTTDRTIKKT